MSTVNTILWRERDVKIGLATLVGALLVSAQALAQEDSRFRLIAGGNLSLPVAPDLLKNGWNGGFGMAGGFGFKLLPTLEIQGVMSYDRFPLDKERITGHGVPSNSSSRDMDAPFLSLFGVDPDLIPSPFEDIFEYDVSGFSEEILSFSCELRFSFAGERRLTPYVLGGGGVTRFSVDTGTRSTAILGMFVSEYTLEGISETAPHLAFGCGVDIRASSRFVILGEVRYQITFTDGENTGHATVRGGVRIGL
jgi:hypothetical protein